MTFDIDAAQQLCDNATEGPWRRGEADARHEIWANRDPAGWDAFLIATTDTRLNRGNDNDTEFIAAARTLLPDALDEIRRLRAQVQRVEALPDDLDYYIKRTDHQPATADKCVAFVRAALGEPS